MTQEEVVFMLVEAIDQDREYKSWHVSTKHLMTLAKMVAEKEREACAKLCDAVSQDMSLGPLEKYRASWLANEIRARGQA